MSAGAIKAQGLLPPLLLHRYRWILPSICIHHGWHVFHGGTAVTGVRQSSIIPGLTIPNLLYRPFSLRQKFFFLPHQYRRNARKCISTLSRICRSRINVMFQKKIKNDSIPYTLIYARQNSKKKKNLHYTQVSQITVISSSNYVNDVIVRWISLNAPRIARVRIFTLWILASRIIKTEKESLSHRDQKFRNIDRRILAIKITWRIVNRFEGRVLASLNIMGKEGGGGRVR